MANPIRKLVQLVLDKNAARKTEADAKKTLSAVDKGLAKLKSSALKLGGAIAAAFAVKKIFQFGKELIRVANESESIWNRLGQAVENVGINFAVARPEVEAFARAMQDTTKVGDEDFAAILTELITTSGDYKGSLEAVAIVADLAAAKQIELVTASQLVGRAMIGQTGTLSRYGIVLEEGQDAMEVLRDTFRGFAANEVKGLEGQVAQLNNEWGDFKQALGEVLTAAANGESILQRLTSAVRGMTEAVGRFRDRLDPIGKFQREQMAEVLALGKDEILLQEKRFELGQKILRLSEEQARLQATIAEKQQRRIIPLSLVGDQLAAEALEGKIKALQSVIIALDNIVDTQGAPTSGPAPAATAAAADDQDKLTDAQKEGIQIARSLRTAQEEYADTVQRLDELLLSRAITRETYYRGMLRAGGLLNEAEIAAEDFTATLGKVETGLEDVGWAAERTEAQYIAMNAAADAGATIAEAVFSSANLGELAAQKAKQNAIMAAEQLALAGAAALVPGLGLVAADHLKNAAAFAAVSAAWGSIAGVSGGSGGGGGGGAPSDTGGAASERTEAPGPEVHSHFVGPGFNAVNPEVQRVIYGAQQEISQRYGNAKPKIHRDR